MLQSLHIENVAVIEQADIAFGPGLTVLTGETGAGKSIVIDAINAVLGERISREVVRTGADKAYVAAVFGDLSPAVVDALGQWGYAPDEDGSLLIRRSIAADGRGACHIGDRPATVSTLRQLGRMLVNIHGQHENQNLLQADRHVEYLDRLGDIRPIHAAYEKEYREYCRIRREIKAVSTDESTRQARVEDLTARIAAIDAAAIHPGEEAELLAKRELARHAEKLAAALHTVSAAMDDDPVGDAPGVLSRLADATAALQGVAVVSADMEALAGRLQSTLYDVQAVADEVAGLQDTLAFDEAALAALEDRLALLSRLIKQYGTDEAAVLEARERMATELDSLQGADKRLAVLEQQSDAARAATIEAAGKLTAARKQAAAKFEQDVQRELRFLDMPHVTLQVSLEPTPLNAIGGDKVEFLISSNPGEPPKSIARTASGGELSRIMLALKTVLAEVDDIDSLVFDEVDAGISGRAATKVGTLLRRIAACRQVLCVTHLAQIAAHGHHHLLVAKSVAQGRTFTRVDSLPEQGRLEELARIMGGQVTALTMEAARELRDHAEKVE